MKHIAAALIAGVLLTGCTATVAGEAAAPETVTTTSSAPVSVPIQTPDEVPPAYRSLADDVNEIVADNASFWVQIGALLPESAFVVDDATEGLCGKPSVTTKTPAWACGDEKVMTIYAPIMEKIDTAVPDDLGIAAVIGHESGHIALPQLDPSADTGGNLEERRADCASGAYMRWIADGNSAAISTPSDADLSTARRKMMKSRDRQAAYDHGWDHGPQSCVTYREN